MPFWKPLCRLFTISFDKHNQHFTVTHNTQTQRLTTFYSLQHLCLFITLIKPKLCEYLIDLTNFIQSGLHVPLLLTGKWITFYIFWVCVCRLANQHASDMPRKILSCFSVLFFHIFPCYVTKGRFWDTIYCTQYVLCYVV